MQITDGAWLLALETPTLPPASSTNTLILGAERLLVIEPATPHPREQAHLDALLDHLQAEGRTLAGLCLTHHHVDHIGYAEALRERHGVPIFAHAETAARLSFPVDQHIDEGWSLALGDGMIVEALATPGHAPGHLLFWERRTGIAHAGDLVAGQGTILIDPEDSGDMAVYLDSLRRVAARCRELGGCLVPAHGPMLYEPVAVLEHFIRHRLAREDRVRQAVHAGAREFQSIVAAAYADTPRAPLMIAALSVEAHLRKLVADGELVREGRGARPAT